MGGGLWSKNEVEVLVVVSTPRVGEVIVTVLPLMLTTPVKSSMSSSWFVPRLALARGRLKAEKTLTPAVAGVKVTVMVPPVTLMELFRLKSMPRPILAPPERVTGNGAVVILGRPAALGLIVQMAPTVQLPEAEVALVMVALVLLRKVI